MGETETLEVWMSAGATPSLLMSATSALAACAFAVTASPAFFPVLVTPSVTSAKSGAALTPPSPVTSTQRLLLMSVGGSSACAGEIAASAGNSAIKAKLSRNVSSRAFAIRRV